MSTNDIFNLKNYRAQEIITLVVAGATILFSFTSVYYFLSSSWNTRNDFISDDYAPLTLGFWIFAPPIWFFFEYFILWNKADDDKKKMLNEARAIAQPFWGAVLITLLFLIPQ